MGLPLMDSGHCISSGGWPANRLSKNQFNAVLFFSAVEVTNEELNNAHAIFEEIVKLGEANVRRIYGDFSGTRLAGWNKQIQSLAILQHQQRSNKTGKNASDIAFVIDAMDLMHKGKIDGFCLVSRSSACSGMAGRWRGHPPGARLSTRRQPNTRSVRRAGLLLETTAVVDASPRWMSAKPRFCTGRRTHDRRRGKWTSGIGPRAAPGSRIPACSASLRKT